MRKFILMRDLKITDSIQTPLIISTINRTTTTSPMLRFSIKIFQARVAIISSHIDTLTIRDIKQVIALTLDLKRNLALI